MDEAEFLRYLKDKFPLSAGVGIGDDTSIVLSCRQPQLISQDLFIEGLHFTLPFYSIEEVARKALAVNVSDIAAMGGEAEYFYLGLGAPPTFSRNDLSAFFNALQMGCRDWGVDLAGGDFSRAPALIISITIVGNAARPIRRDGACVGDLIGITGNPGESALGLKIAESGLSAPVFIRRHKEVVPEIRKGCILARRANSMIDVSDGLLLDLQRILSASHCGAIVQYERIPISGEFRETCSKYSINEQELVLSGGEDYYLLFTVSEKNESILKGELDGYTLIGSITETPESLQVSKSGTVIEIPRLGFDHFLKR